MALTFNYKNKENGIICPKAYLKITNWNIFKSGISIQYIVYKDKTSKELNKKPIDTVSYSIPMTSTKELKYFVNNFDINLDITENFITLLYTCLKSSSSEFKNAKDI